MKERNYLFHYLNYDFLRWAPKKAQANELSDSFRNYLSDIFSVGGVNSVRVIKAMC